MHPLNDNYTGINNDLPPKSIVLKKVKPESTKFKKKEGLKQSCLKFVSSPKNNQSKISDGCSSEDTDEIVQNKVNGKSQKTLEKKNLDKDKNNTKIHQSFFNNIDKFKMSTVQKALFYKKLENCYEKTIQKVEAFRIFSEALTEAMSLHIKKEEKVFCQQMIKFGLMRFVFENSSDSWHKIYKPLCSKDVSILFSFIQKNA